MTCGTCASERVAGGTLYRQVYSSGGPDQWWFGVFLARPDGSAVSALESVTAPDEHAARSKRQLTDADLARLAQDPGLTFLGP